MQAMEDWVGSHSSANTSDIMPNAQAIRYSLKGPYRCYLPVRRQSFPLNHNSTVAASITLGLLSQAWLDLQLFSFRSLLA